MAIIRELRARVRSVAGPVFAICVVGYFAYHAVHGERGLIAWWHLRGEVAKAEVAAASTAERLDAWQARVGKLRPATLSLDLLEERARKMLGYARPRDIIVLTGDRPLARVGPR